MVGPQLFSSMLAPSVTSHAQSPVSTSHQSPTVRLVPVHLRLYGSSWLLSMPSHSHGSSARTQCGPHTRHAYGEMGGRLGGGLGGGGEGGGEGGSAMASHAQRWDEPVVKSMSGTDAHEVAEAQHSPVPPAEPHESWSKPMQVARLQQSSRH